MNISKINAGRLMHLAERYDIVTKYALASGKKTVLRDHLDGETRRCRFCGRADPDVTFRKTAHAIPEFLGNKSLISMNECDACNQMFAAEYEDHLAKWFGPMRTVAQIPGKKGVPTYKSKDKRVRIEMRDSGLHFEIRGGDTADLKERLDSGGPMQFKIPIELTTQPFIPIRAAKAAVKAACAVVPPHLLPKCQAAISWLMKHESLSCEKFTVLWSFTPGPRPFGAGYVMFCEAKPGRDLPLMFLLVFANFCFQVIVPLSNKNAGDVFPGSETYLLPVFPPPVDADHENTYGKSEFHEEDWAGEDRIVKTRDFEMHIDQAKRIN